ncbi:hypothetical protein O3M35_001381 [Rhynocoris fuscipes]|uniref:Tetratricopeptide repeat protein 29 n=1 Tax=Rhynocoris fuscipes TaxID=488301 RepID=A0AAW1CR76_9HEMI
MSKEAVKKRDYLKELIDRFKEPVVETGFTRTDQIPTLRNHPCTEDISAINVASTTSFFDNLMSTRLIEEPIETVSLDKIRELHKKIYNEIMEQQDAILENFEEAKYDAPPDIRMIKKILEQGYIDAAKRVIDLINLEIRIRDGQIHQDRSIENKPRIENNFNTIRAFLLLFRKADKCRKLGKIEEEATIYLNLATYYVQEGIHWLWLSYEFFTMSINACNDYHGDNGLTEATVRYVFGKFCFLRIRYLKEALIHLGKARKLSAGRSWTASGYTGIKDDYIYPSARTLLYLTNIAMITEGEVTEPKDILHHLQEALIISENEGEFLEILVPLADAYNNVDNPREAIKYLTQYKMMAKDNPNVPEHMALTNMDFVKDMELRFCYYYTKG